jgi:cation diffusion facilitator family transporter
MLNQDVIMSTKKSENYIRKTRVATLSVASNSILVLIKFIVGITIGSVSIISEAIHSGVDLLAAVIALFSVRTSGIPADKQHPWGHGKIENISGTVEAILIFLAAAWIIYEAIHKLMNPSVVGETSLGVIVMLISVLVNIFVSHNLFKVGKETDSVALMADAWHLRTDVYTSGGVMIGMTALFIDDLIKLPFNLHWVDPVAAMVVALMIIKAAFQLTKESAKDLMDVGLPPSETNWIHELVIMHRPQVLGFHQLRTRKAGHFRFVEFHLMVDPYMTVEASHDITDDLSMHISEHFPDTSVTIHVEPCNGNCIPKCVEGCFLNETERRKQQ